MKRYLGMLLTSLAATALILLSRTNVELKYKCETLAWQAKGETDQLKAIIAPNLERVRRDAQKIAELEAKLKGPATEISRGD